MNTLPRTELERFGDLPKPTAWWGLPVDARARLAVMGLVLGWLGDTDLVLWRGADWPQSDWVVRADDSSVVEFEIMRGVGVPVGSDLLIQAGSADYASVLTLMLCAAEFGWAPPHDLNLLAPHQGVLITATHHDKLSAAAVEPGAVEALVEYMTTQEMPPLDR